MKFQKSTVVTYHSVAGNKYRVGLMYFPFHIINKSPVVTSSTKNLNLSKVLKCHIPAGIYLFKVNNRNTRARCEICSKLTINTPERRQWRFWCIYC